MDHSCIPGKTVHWEGFAIGPLWPDLGVLRIEFYSACGGGQGTTKEAGLPLQFYLFIKHFIPLLKTLSEAIYTF